MTGGFESLDEDESLTASWFVQGGRLATPPVFNTDTAVRNSLTAYNDVVTMVTGTSGLTLRGLSPQSTSIRLDGIEIPQSYHFGAVRPILPVGFIESATFYTGNYPVNYGDTVGGLFVLGTRSEIPQRTTGYIDANLADVSGMLRVPLAKNLALSLSGTYGYLDKTFAAVVPRQSDIALAYLPRYHDG